MVHISETILLWLEEAAAACGDGVLLALLAAPPLLFLLAFVLRLCIPRLRALPLRPLQAAADVCLLLYLCLCLLHPQLRPRLYAAAALILLEKLALCALLTLLRLPGRKKRRGPRPASPPLQAEPAASPLQPPPPPPPPAEGMPAKVLCCEGQEERETEVEKDVRLGHIFGVLERLKQLPLSPGDRLEAEKAQQLLAAYRAKRTLCAKEAETLNDILAALLKMMAKYQY